MSNHRKKLLCLAVAGVCMYASWSSAADTAGLWREVPQANAGQAATARTQGAASKSVVPSEYRVFTLDFGGLKTELNTNARSIRSGQGNTLALPTPEGGITYFTLSDSNVLPDALAKRYPDIKSYKGVDDKGRRLRLDLSPAGVQAIVMGDPDGAWSVQPEGSLDGVIAAAPATGGRYWSFRRAKLPAPRTPFKEDVLQQQLQSRIQTSAQPEPMTQYVPVVTGIQRRNYRLAVAATSGYASAFGFSKPLALAAIVRTVNRVNEIYETDLGVHMTLVADNDKVIFTDPKTDPFKSGSPLDVNPRILNQAFGKNGYDIGHVVDSGDNGVASLGVVCSADKGSGYTGRNNPVGDPFDVDYVAHEMGHQFGANHTFNGCYTGSQREARSAYEPGSGSTVMGYAGICGNGNDLQPNSDPYFHAVNLAEISRLLADREGKCAATVANTQYPAWIDQPALMKRYVVPARTPFALTVNARSANPDAVLSYAWEQTDLGPIQPSGQALKDDGVGPIFRSYNASQPQRIFPRLAAVLGDEPLGPGEVYPSTTRDLNFRVTVRDGYGAQATTASGDTSLKVFDTGRSFAITFPKDVMVTQAGKRYAVRWDVAGTDKQPIACRTVRIDLSLDGGHSWLPKALADAASNNGRAEVTMPAVERSATAGRLKVSCVGNVFFAVSPTNFVVSK